MHTIHIEQNLGNLNNTLLEETRDFIKTNFEDQLYRICHRHYKFKFWGWVDENCFTEGSNASLSRDVLGPKPKHKLHQAADCIIQHTESTFNKVTTGAINEFSSRKIKKKNESADDVVARELSATIIESKLDLAMEQYMLSGSYSCMEIAGTDLLHPIAVNADDLLYIVKRNKTSFKEPKHRRPIYERTRVVVVKKILIEGASYVSIRCSCGFTPQHHCTCRHVNAILNR